MQAIEQVDSWKEVMCGLYFVVQKDGQNISQSTYVPGYRALNAAKAAFSMGAAFVQLNCIGRDAGEAHLMTYYGNDDPSFPRY